ncbi:MAG TPA: histidinol-phosphate transaminase, partial [Spirochaetia bacterium]|nr:histidinol-phosphate transaminase [Spirochaetia bacterium]
MFSRRLSRLTPYTAGEQPQDRRYIKLNTNENPYPPSPAIE